MVTPLNIILVGASGDLAQRKVLPALFSLFAQKLLPAEVRIFGFARTPLTDAEFRRRTAEHLMCRYTPEAHECATMTEQFLARCHYVTGEYGKAESFLDVAERIQQVTGRWDGDRLFYLATPPSVFLDVARAIGNSGLVTCDDTESWTRIVIEKPFGHDRASSDELVAEFGIQPSDMLVVVDDFNLPLGAVRIRPRGSDGGHNGLISLIEELGTTDFPRIRLGIGPATTDDEVIDFVLGKFSSEERKQVDEMIVRAADAVLFALEHRLEETMSKYNFNPALPESN